MTETSKLIKFLKDAIQTPILYINEERDGWCWDEKSEAMLIEIKEKLRRLEWHDIELQKAHETVAKWRDNE